MKTLAFLFVLQVMLVTFSNVQAQAHIHGTVTDKKGSPLINANVLLLKPSDSSLVKGTVTIEKGVYAFQNIPFGKYIILSTFTGFENAYSEPVSIDESKTVSVAALRLSETSVQLGNVNVQ